MSKAALFVGWGAIIPGREKAAQKVLAEAVEYLVKLQQEGEIDSFEPVALEPHGGELIGFVLVRGEKEKVSQLRTSEAFARIMIQVQLVHTNVGVVGAYMGAEMGALFHTWDSETEALLSESS